MKMPTKRQQSIITDGHFPRYLTAGPGTGKTEVLINKIVYLLKGGSGLEPEEFAVITFTNKAANEMKERLNRRVRELGIPMTKGAGESFHISTIHSFCNKILRRYSGFVGLSPYFEIKSYDKELTALTWEAIDGTKEPLIKAVNNERLYYLVRAMLGECYNHGKVLSMDYLVRETAEDRVWADLERAVLNLCVNIYEKIEEIKKEEQALTLNDLITKTAKLLENENVLKSAAGKYKYLFIDEFQDTNRSQLDIVKLFIKAGVKVFLIGDEKQSIYGFRGADIECSKEVGGLMAADGDFYINENFRTDWPLLEKINEVFDKKFMYKGKALNFPQVPLTKTEELKALEGACGNPFRVYYEAEPIAVAEGLLKEKIKIRDRFIKPEDIFILCRTNDEVWQLSNELKLRGEPKLLGNGAGKGAITALYKVFSGLIFGDEGALKELRLVFGGKGVGEIIEYIYEKAENLGDVESLAKLKAECYGMDALDFFEYLEKMLEGDEIEPPDSYEPRFEGITVMTIHKAKGLSLPVVIVPNIDRKLIVDFFTPDFIIEREAGVFAIGDIIKRGKVSKRYVDLLERRRIRDLEEEIRILYVAMTRAEHMLVMTGRKSRGAINNVIGIDGEETVSWGQWLG
ncbi:MAG: ATP-dependent helicase [Defluviitaleaceae bacterium]|nr:ATP-dependent helicase [Defluviitaleaceae bacterium]